MIGKSWQHTLCFSITLTHENNFTTFNLIFKLHWKLL